MKKIVIIFVLVALIGSGGYFYLQSSKSQFQIENVLPQKPLAYFKINDVEENLNKIEGSPFWQKLSSIDYEKFVEKTAANQKRLEAIKEIKSQIFSDTTSLIYKKFFSEEFAVAFYPNDFDFNQFSKDAIPSLNDVLEGMFSSIFVVTRIKPEAQVAEFFSRAFKKYGDVQTESKHYNEQTFYLITVPNSDVKIGYIRINNLMVMGFGEDTVKNAIDVYQTSKPSLTNDKGFNEFLNKAINPHGILSFFDAEGIFDLLEDHSLDLVKASQQDPQEALDQMEEFFKTAAGFKTFGISADIDELSTIQANIFYNKNEIDKDIAAVYLNCSSTDNKTLSFVPKHVLGYQWSHCLDLEYYWKEVKREWAQAAKAEGELSEEEAIAGIEQKIGLSIEKDIIAAFGSEFGGYLSQIKSGGMFPIPEFLFFIEVVNKDLVEKMFATLTEQPFLILQSEQYAGVSMNYLASPLGEMLEPSYCYLDDYLLVSINRKLLKASIDAFKDKSKALASSEQFKQVNFGLDDKNISVQYIELGALVKSLKGIVEWSNDWVTQRDQQKEAFRGGSEKRLADITAELEENKKALAELKQRVVDAQKEKQDLELKGMDASTQDFELARVKESIAFTEDAIESAKEQQKELKEFIEGYESGGVDVDDRRLFLDEVLYPLLDGLESIGVIGSRTTMNDSMIESTTYFK